MLTLQENFLRRFIEEEKYLLNEPLKTKDFIDYCKKRGIITNENELEFFEKEGLLYPIIRIDRPVGEEERLEFKKDDKIYWRPAHLGLEEGEEEIRRYNEKYYSFYAFDEYHNNYLLNWLDEGNLFDPSMKPFKEWASFKREELDYDSEKIVSFYSHFQLHWLILLKENYRININLASDEIIVSSSLNRLNGFRTRNSFRIKDFDEINAKLKEKSVSEIDKLFFDIDSKKEELKKMYENFEKVLEFLLSIQSVYVPYGKSSSKSIHISDESWYKKRNEFDPKKELNELRTTMEEIEALYAIFCENTMQILGVKRDDWIQLWKSLAWNEKDELEGDIRLGIEYLQWTLMIKRFIEDYCGREILDIDEMSNISYNDILKFNPPEMDQYGMLLRASRNKMYFDKKNEENHFHNTYKRLFYLANDFEIDYHHRLIVFVEGKTELKILPKFFEFTGNTPENLGIGFINIEGITKFYGKKFNVQENQKRNKVILNNFLNLINYTLNKWQTLPFFIGDNENNIKKLLKEGICLESDYGAEKRSLPKKWYHTWNKDFELDNFTNDEIAVAINKVLSTQIESEEVEKIRNNGKGIKSLDKRIADPGNKIEINDVLYENLLEEYKNSKDKNILNRPIFNLIKKLKIMALRNHPPSNTSIETKNKEIIADVIDGRI